METDRRIVLDRIPKDGMPGPRFIFTAVPPGVCDLATAEKWLLSTGKECNLPYMATDEDVDVFVEVKKYDRWDTDNPVFVKRSTFAGKGENPTPISSLPAVTQETFPADHPISKVFKKVVSTPPNYQYGYDPGITESVSGNPAPMAPDLTLKEYLKTCKPPTPAESLWNVAAAYRRRAEYLEALAAWVDKLPPDDPASKAFIEVVRAYIDQDRRR